MKAPEPPFQGFNFKDPKQKKIHQELIRQIGEGAASFYMDACKLMDDNPPLSSKTHLIAHLLREIDSSIRDVMIPFGYLSPKEEAFNNLMDEIIKQYNISQEDSLVQLWDKLKITKDAEQFLKEATANQQYQNTPHKDLITVWSKFRNSSKDEGFSNEIYAIAEEYELDSGDNLVRLWLRLRKLNVLAHRDSLARPRGLDDNFLEIWDSFQALISAVLTLISENYARYIEYIDNLLAKSQIKAGDIQELKTHLPNNTVTLGYFFEKLQDPRCVPMLKARGFFKNPLNPLSHPEGGVSYPYWPQSAYLIRMSKVSSAQKDVLEVCLDIETENVTIQADILEIAASLPVDMSLKLLEKAKLWIKDRGLWILSEKYGQLISHLAKEGKADEAIDLARIVLAITPDPKYSQRVGDDSAYILPPDPTAYFDDHEYQEVLRAVMPDLVKGSREKAIDMEARLLDDAITFSLREPNKPHDCSYIWQPAIENHSQNLLHGLKTIILVNLRDTCEILLKEDPTLLNGIVQLIEKHEWEVFDRLVLHLLRVFPAGAAKEIKEKLLDISYYSTTIFEHEFFLLIQEQSHLLSKEKQEQILTLINNGPTDVNALEKRLQEESQKDIPEIIEKYKKRWQQNHLAPFTDTFPEYKALYDPLTQELGELDHPEFSSYVSGDFFGPTSPKSSQEILEAEPAETIELMRTWQPTAQRFEDSREGLGRELTKAIAEDPEKFALAAEEFKDLDPIYIRSIISGFREAIKSNKKFTWENVFALCSWVVEQEKTIPGRELQNPFEDPDWDWTFSTIVEFLNDAIKDNKMPITLREDVWIILEKLSNDPSPTPEDEAKSGKDFDPASLSINSTRPKALHAVMQYALWIRRVEIKQLGEEAARELGFSTIPEVQRVLEQHLDTVKDPSLAVRSVYGQWLSSLIFLDKKWVIDNLSEIMPRDENLAEYRRVAWETYIDFNNPYNEVLDILHGEFLISIEELGKHPKLKSHQPVSPDDRLAQHLGIYYWRGKLDIGSDLIVAFYNKASDEIAARAMEALGRGLAEVASLEEDIKNRLKDLWIKRFENAKQDPSSHKKELREFGTWFISKKYDGSWSLAQLKEVLEITGDIESDHQVSERLVELSSHYPEEVIDCIRLMIDGDKRA